jgi:hypothetical protein
MYASRRFSAVGLFRKGEACVRLMRLHSNVNREDADATWMIHCRRCKSWGCRACAIPWEGLCKQTDDIAAAVQQLLDLGFEFDGWNVPPSLFHHRSGSN